LVKEKKRKEKKRKGKKRNQDQYRPRISTWIETKHKTEQILVQYRKNPNFDHLFSFASVSLKIM
jgi:hypothetical protein